MRIYLDQGGAYGNLGDEAMLLVAAERLRRLFPGCQLVIAAEAGEPLPELGACERVDPPGMLLKQIGLALTRRRWLMALGSCVHGAEWDASWRYALAHCPRLLPADLRAFRRKLLGTITGCDLYYAVGAANLHDWSLRDCVLPRAWTVEQFARLGKTTVISCQTVGPLETPLAAKLVRRMVRQATHVTLRDAQVSSDCLMGLGLSPDRWECIGDEALALTPAPAAAVQAYLNQAGLPSGEPFALVHVREKTYRGRLAPNNPVLARTLTHLAQERPVLLCPMSYGSHSGDDAAFAQRVVQALGRPPRVLAGPSIRDVRLVRGLVERCHSVVSLSYHLQVFALAVGKPLVCLSSGAYYQHKVRALQGWLEPRLRWTIDLDRPETDPAMTCREMESLALPMHGYLQAQAQRLAQRQADFFARLVGSTASPVTWRRHCEVAA